MFNDAISYIRKYRENKANEYCNFATPRWFTSDVDSLEELETEIFNVDSEDAEWQQAYEAKDNTSIDKMNAIRTKINYIISCLKAVRDRYITGNSGESKTPIDFDRYAMHDAYISNQFSEQLERQIAYWESN